MSERAVIAPAEEQAGIGLGVDLATWVRERLVDWHRSWVRETMTRIADLMMGAEARSIAEADGTTSSRSPVSGRRNVIWSTAVGDLRLGVPRVRSGRYAPVFLEQGDARLAAEDAITSFIVRASLVGVSAEMVAGLARSLGLMAVSNVRATEIATKLNRWFAQFQDRPLDGEPHPYLRVEAISDGLGETAGVMTAVVWAVGASGKKEVLAIRALT
ncbi:MAG TPA: transposase, partial [Patescibacteria group bacterium]|nr:transposase [Patescibacteria group bacterium]